MSYIYNTYIKNTHIMTCENIRLLAPTLLGKTDRALVAPKKVQKIMLDSKIARIQYLKGYSIIN